MKNSLFGTALILGAMLAAGCSGERFDTVDRPDTSPRNSHYVSNRAPMQPQYFIKLPIGDIKPAGWIARQLELQADGLNGHLGEISSWLVKENNAWLGLGDENQWEELPYWLRGYAASAEWWMFSGEKSSIDEIIYKSGFSNRGPFFRAFAEKFGCTPREYREKHIKGVI